MEETPLKTPPTLNRRDTLDVKIIEHDIEVQDEIRHNTYESCCLRIDKGMLKYIIQQVIIVGLMIFCGERLFSLPSCDGKDYMGLLSLLIGLSLPSPLIDKDTDKPNNK